MGFWDKVKSVKNMVTGGGAEIIVATEQTENSLDQPLIIHIKAMIKDADIKIDKVYLYIRATEEVVARDIDMVRDRDGDFERYVEDVSNTVQTFKTEIVVDGPQTLDANETYEWTTEVDLPSNLNGTYRGENASHEWEMYAGLDAFGNDPDSGWVRFDIY